MDSSADSSGDENDHDYNQQKRQSSDYDPDEIPIAKRPRFNSEDLQDDSFSKENNSSFETSGVKNFYDRNYYSTDTTDDEDKSQSSGNQDGVLSGNEDNASTIQSDSGFGSNTVLNNSDSEKSQVKESAAERMMKKWGYKSGQGLGKDLQGRAEPVEQSTQKGRRGLGLELKELANAKVEFNPDDEIVEYQEKIDWLKCDHEHIPSIDEVGNWKINQKIGKRPVTIYNQTVFCDEIIVRGVVNSKSVFDRLDKNEMRDARTRSNPFETIYKSIFLNRAAVKMANMDRVCDFMFTQPQLPTDQLLYFADVCAGPGGFSEYVLYRKKWRAKGFGFTLKNENDFKLHDFHAGPCETFHPYYGPKENGDVYDPENQLAFKDLIMEQTRNEGVHFMMADGGFSVDGQENIQEILSKQLYLCQCLVALMIVRTGGHFVTKVFDLFTPFSAGIVYIMYRCFKYVSVFKPNTSRPANSERYLICKSKLPNIDHITDYLFEVNKKLLKNDLNNDVLDLVPLQILLSDNKFFEYLKTSNEELGERQIVGLKKIAAYAEDKNLFELRQKSMREKCLKFWELPDEQRVTARRMNPQNKAHILLESDIDILEKGMHKNAVKLTKNNLQVILDNENDWFCMPCSFGDEIPIIAGDDVGPTFYLGLGRSNVYKYNKGRWEPFRNPGVEMPRDTLIYAEWVLELRKEDRSQSKTYALHILDAFMLGSENISDRYLTDRHKFIQLFCRAIWKPTDRSTAPVRFKDLLPVNEDLDKKLPLQWKSMKNGMKVKGYSPERQFYENDNVDSYYYVPRSILFFKATEGPWARHKSSSNQLMYFFNKENRQSRWEIPSSARASFIKCIETRLIWNWPSDQSLTMDSFIDCLKQKYARSKQAR